MKSRKTKVSNRKSNSRSRISDRTKLEFAVLCFVIAGAITLSFIL